jgi:hypothetical protein
VALRANPVEDVRALEDVEYVVKAGEIVKRPADALAG